MLGGSGGIAHNTEFERQQVQRLRAVMLGRVPPEFPEVDHASAARDELAKKLGVR